MKITEWDPYDHIMEVTRLLNEVTDAHNRLSKHYEQQMKRVKILEERVDDLETHLLDRAKRS